jgi:GrpB-like predicted nucleotidyltransferase (UPF0157 family)
MTSVDGAYRPGGPIVLVSHDPRWAEGFTREAAAIAEALGDLLTELHHIGSTAVPGLAAKPVIDMLAVVTDVDRLDQQGGALEALNYEPMGEFGIRGRRYFRKNTASGVRTHQIHAYAVGADDIERHLVFRDYLRANPAAAAQYASLKHELAERFAADIEGYADGKTDFVREIERRVSGGAR